MKSTYLLRTRVSLRSLIPCRHRAYTCTCRSVAVLGCCLSLLFFSLFFFLSLSFSNSGPWILSLLIATERVSGDDSGGDDSGNTS